MDGRLPRQRKWLRRNLLVRGNEIKKILNKGLAECLLQALEPEDSCDFMMSELEGFELDIEGGTSWRS